jgi:hypothetical protein
MKQSLALQIEVKNYRHAPSYTIIMFQDRCKSNFVRVGTKYTYSQPHAHTQTRARACVLCELEPNIHIVNPTTHARAHAHTHTHTREVSRNPNFNALQSNRPQHDHPAASVIVQQYSSAPLHLTVLSLPQGIFTNNRA